MNFIPSDDCHPFRYYWDENATGVTANGKQYKGIVIAIMEVNPYEVINRLENIDVDVEWVGRSEYFMRYTFKGIAYCSSEDSFDLKKGMRIAKLRALEKYFNNKYKALDAIKTKNAKDYNKINDMLSDIVYNSVKIYCKLKKLEEGE